MKEEEQDNQTPSSSTLPRHQNGRSHMPAQPVTVASASPHKILTLALPIQQPRPPTTGGGGSGGGGGGAPIQPSRPPPAGGGREDCWSDMATSILINAWGERYLELSRGNLKQNHWKDVADIVSSRDESRKIPKTDVQCKNRIDTLKKKYKLEKSKIVSGQGPSKWIFFDRIDQLIGSNTKISTTAAAAYTRGADLDSGQRILRPLRHIQQDKRQEQTMNSNSSQEAAPPSPDSTDSLPPPETSNRKRPHFEPNSKCNPNPGKRKKVKGKGWGESMRELSQAIQEFGQAYERMESSKLQQMVEIEKQRMGLAKDLELKRMQFFMETQMELTQVKGRIVSNKHHNNMNK